MLNCWRVVSISAAVSCAAATPSFTSSYDSQFMCMYCERCMTQIWSIVNTASTRRITCSDLEWVLMTCWHNAPEIFPSRFLSCQHIWMVNCCQSFLSLLGLELFYHSKWCVNTRRGLFDFKSCCQNLRKDLTYSPPPPHTHTHTKIGFACCYFTWLFAGGFMCRVWH